MGEKSHSSWTWTFSRLVFTCFFRSPVWWIWGKHSQLPRFPKCLPEAEARTCFTHSWGKGAAPWSWRGRVSSLGPGSREHSGCAVGSGGPLSVWGL